MLLPLILWYAALSGFAFWAFGFDKAQARGRGRRVPERTLHLLTLAGGAAGSLLGMRRFRHKTKHQSLWVIRYAALALHAAVLVGVASGLVRIPIALR